MPKGYCQRKPVEWFIERSRAVHGDKYDYSKVEYLNNRTHIVIRCTRCGSDFKILPFNHFHGHGCKSCSDKSRTRTTDQFIAEAKIIHGDKFSYENTVYINSTTKVSVKCNQCEETFLSPPMMHLWQRTGCPNCKSSKGETKIASILQLAGLPFSREQSFPKCRGVGGKPLRFDFFIPSLSLCIEYDGRQHYDPSSKFWSADTVENDAIKEHCCVRHRMTLRRIKQEDFNRVESLLAEIITIEMPILETQPT